MTHPFCVPRNEHHEHHDDTYDCMNLCWQHTEITEQTYHIRDGSKSGPPLEYAWR